MEAKKQQPIRLAPYLQELIKTSELVMTKNHLTLYHRRSDKKTFTVNTKTGDVAYHSSIDQGKGYMGIILKKEMELPNEVPIDPAYLFPKCAYVSCTQYLNFQKGKQSE